MSFKMSIMADKRVTIFVYWFIGWFVCIHNESKPSTQ